MYVTRRQDVMVFLRYIDNTGHAVNLDEPEQLSKLFDHATGVVFHIM